MSSVQWGTGIYIEQVKLGYLLPLVWSSMSLSCLLPPLGPRPLMLWEVRESVLHDHCPGASVAQQDGKPAAASRAGEGWEGRGEAHEATGRSHLCPSVPLLGPSCCDLCWLWWSVFVRTEQTPRTIPDASLPTKPPSKWP